MSDANKHIPASAHSIWTPANIVTTVRVVLIPLWLLSAEIFFKPAQTAFELQTFLVALFYVVISLTDKLDGYLARSRNEITNFGKFLDPIADKLAVVVAFVFLLEKSMISSWVLLIIVAREFLVSGLRMIVASEGVVVAASTLGKWKTATTMISICGLLVVSSIPVGLLYHSLYIFSVVMLVIAVVLTAWSGIDYTLKCWDYVKKSD